MDGYARLFPLQVNKSEISFFPLIGWMKAELYYFSYLDKRECLLMMKDALAFSS